MLQGRNCILDKKKHFQFIQEEVNFFPFANMKTNLNGNFEKYQPKILQNG